MLFPDVCLDRGIQGSEPSIKGNLPTHSSGTAMSFGTLFYFVPCLTVKVLVEGA